jgi:hypothetical protein
VLSKTLKTTMMNEDVNLLTGVEGRTHLHGRKELAVVQQAIGARWELTLASEGARYYLRARPAFGRLCL